MSEQNGFKKSNWNSHLFVAWKKMYVDKKVIFCPVNRRFSINFLWAFIFSADSKLHFGSNTKESVALYFNSWHQTCVLHTDCTLNFLHCEPIWRWSICTAGSSPPRCLSVCFIASMHIRLQWKVYSAIVWVDKNKEGREFSSIWCNSFVTTI